MVSLCTLRKPSNMKVAIYGRKMKTAGFEVFFKTLVSLLDEHHIEFALVSSYGKFIQKTYGTDYPLCDSTELAPANFTCLISLGGDGTVLDTLLLIRDSELPVMGINLGRLGFLANIQNEEIEEAVVALKEGRTIIEKRALIQIDSDISELNDFPYALNDFVVQKRDTSAMITVKASLNDYFLNNYWADGLIVATPTGSSGYSLSCGGPLLFPGSKSLVITPIAAHNLTVRPAVISDDTVLKIETSSRADSVLITLDNRSFIVPANTVLTLKRSHFDFHMIKLNENSYLDTIRNKLLWGADKRDFK